jgi:hypothetical protein
MMTIVELIQKHFLWLEQAGFSISIRNSPSVMFLYEIRYDKLNTSIVFSCDTRESTFSFEIFIVTPTKSYSISEYLASESGIHHRNNQFDIVYQRVFDYSGSMFDEVSFQNEKNEFLSRKSYEDIVCLYSNLIKEALPKIELLSK